MNECRISCQKNKERKRKVQPKKTVDEFSLVKQLYNVLFSSLTLPFLSNTSLLHTYSSAISRHFKQHYKPLYHSFINWHWHWIEYLTQLFIVYSCVEYLVHEYHKDTFLYTFSQFKFRTEKKMHKSIKLQLLHMFIFIEFRWSEILKAKFKINEKKKKVRSWSVRKRKRKGEKENDDRHGIYVWLNNCFGLLKARTTFVPIDNGKQTGNIQKQLHL